MNNIRTLDLNLLKVMDALLDECNVTRAAQKLFLTQPAVSIMLNRLRDNFKDPLFVRGSHGMVPTDRALALADPIKKILREIMVLVQPVDFNPTELEFTLKIAANDNDMSIIGVPFLLELKKQAPRVKIAFFSYHKLNVQLLLERGELDLILIDPENSPPSLYHRVLFKERYMCVMRKGHPAAKLKKLTLEEFCFWEHVLVSHHGGQFHGVTDDALEKVGLKRNVVLSITSFLVLPSILEKSDFIAVAPEPVVRDLKDMVLKEPPIAVQGFSKIVAWHERNHRDPVQQWIRNLMFTTCNALYN